MAITNEEYLTLAAAIYASSPSGVNEIKLETEWSLISGEPEIGSAGFRAGVYRKGSEVVISQGIEWYYWQGSNYAGQEFLQVSNSVLQYTTAKGHSYYDWADTSWAADGTLTNGVAEADFADVLYAGTAGTNANTRIQGLGGVFVTPKYIANYAVYTREKRRFSNENYIQCSARQWRRIGQCKASRRYVASLLGGKS